MCPPPTEPAPPHQSRLAAQLLLALATAIGLGFAWRMRFLIDDAFISFRYAKNWSEGLGLRFNPGVEPPVEGYSNFLWVAIMTAVHRLGGSMEWASQALGLTAGALLIVLAFLWSHRRLQLGLWPSFCAALFVACSPLVHLWSTSGLETMAYALCFGLCALTWLQALEGARLGKALLAGCLAVMLSLLRVDGSAWAVCIALAGCMAQVIATRQQARPKVSMRGVLTVFLVVLVLGNAAYISYRKLHFGDWLANTVYAKSGISTSSILRGWNQTLTFFVLFPSSVLILAAGVWSCLKPAANAAVANKDLPSQSGSAGNSPGHSKINFGKRRESGHDHDGPPVLAHQKPSTREEAPTPSSNHSPSVQVARTDVWMATLLVVGLLAYHSLVGGDWMPMFRFLVPICLALGLLLGCWLQRLPKLLALPLGLLLTVSQIGPGFNQHFAPLSVREPMYFRNFHKGYETEYDRWQAAVKNVERFTLIGKALKQVSKPGDSIAMGAIGAVGLYSDLFIYDCNGLVNREVARRETESTGGTAGHDKRISPAFFAPQKPTYFLTASVYDPNTVPFEAMIRQFAPTVNKHGMADFCRAEWRRLKPDGDIEANQAIFVLRYTENREAARAFWNGYR